MTADGVFHEGELAVQRRAGVADVAAGVGDGNVRRALTEDFAWFLSQRFFVVVASTDPDGRVWASLLVGPTGFIETPDPTHLKLMAEPAAGDPLQRALDAAPAAVGLLAIEAADRARIRVNGTATRLPEGGIAIEVRESFGNCPKYIQRRVPAELLDEGRRGEVRTRVRHARRGPARRWSPPPTRSMSPARIRSAAPTPRTAGVAPGSSRWRPTGARCASPTTAATTCSRRSATSRPTGASACCSSTGRRGDTLQLSGRAEIVWDAQEIAAWPGAQRLVDVAIEAVEHTPRALPLRWDLIEASKLNPPLPAR